MSVSAAETEPLPHLGGISDRRVVPLSDGPCTILPFQVSCNCNCNCNCQPNIVNKSEVDSSGSDICYFSEFSVIETVMLPILATTYWFNIDQYHSMTFGNTE